MCRFVWFSLVIVLFISLVYVELFICVGIVKVAHDSVSELKQNP